MEYFLQLKIDLVKEEDGDAFRCAKDSDRWNYIPGNLDSMRSAIDSATSYLEERKNKWDGTGITVRGVQIILIRGDGTIINEIDGDHIQIASQIISEMCIL